MQITWRCSVGVAVARRYRGGSLSGLDQLLYFLCSSVVRRVSTSSVTVVWVWRRRSGNMLIVLPSSWFSVRWCCQSVCCKTEHPVDVSKLFCDRPVWSSWWRILVCRPAMACSTVPCSAARQSSPHSPRKTDAHSDHLHHPSLSRATFQTSGRISSTFSVILLLWACLAECELIVDFMYIKSTIAPSEYYCRNHCNSRHPIFCSNK